MFSKTFGISRDSPIRRAAPRSPHAASHAKEMTRVLRQSHRHMETQDAKIVITPGPYLVSGDIGLWIETIGADAAGESVEWQAGREIPAEAKYALCRCGASKTKPFCDGTHKTIGFDGTETASRAPHAAQAKVLDGPDLALEDAEALCSYARFCDRAGTIWKLIGESGDPAVRETVEFEAAACPSGRLVLRDKATGARLESDFEPSIALVEDPAKGASGPIWVRGGIPVVSQDGSTYEVRNRVTLCRCGVSKNKPFCDGSHDDAKFVDGL
jgi:CDGSH-type Zn-finger protein